MSIYSNSVTVIIPTYGRSEFLKRAITSVVTQGHKNVSVQVVDDNGTGTENALRSKQICDFFSAEGHDVRHYSHKSNQGGSAARNTGIRLTETRYCAFLDDDDEYLPDNLEIHLKKLQRTPHAFAYCGYYSVSTKRPKRKLMKFAMHEGDVRHHLLTGWCPASTSLFMVDLHRLTYKLQFDESLPCFQDYDCWLSQSCNESFACCPEPLVLKHQHDGMQLSTDVGKRKLGLSKLENKYEKILSDVEKAIFSQALRTFEQQIEFQYFKLARQNLDLKGILTWGRRYLQQTQGRLTKCNLLLKVLLSPVRY